MRLIYENVAIGLIVQRIGECRAQNNWIPVRSLLVQQTPLEKHYRDTILTYKDKFVVIEFKSPEFKSGNLVYDNIELAKLKNIALVVGEANVLLGLIHATLAGCMQIKTSNLGFYWWWKVPATTVFLPLSNLTEFVSSQNVSSQKSITLKITRAYGSVNPNKVRHIPTCAVQSPINKTESWCLSCGGVYQCGGDPKIILLEFKLGHQSLQAESLTLASLIYKIINCKIGCTVDHTNQRNKKITREEVPKLLRNIAELRHPAILSLRRNVGFQLVPI